MLMRVGIVVGRVGWNYEGGLTERLKEIIRSVFQPHDFNQKSKKNPLDNGRKAASQFVNAWQFWELSHSRLSSGATLRESGA